VHYRLKRTEIEVHLAAVKYSQASIDVIRHGIVCTAPCRPPVIYDYTVNTFGSNGIAFSSGQDIRFLTSE